MFLDLLICPLLVGFISFAADRQDTPSGRSENIIFLPPLDESESHLAARVLIELGESVI